MKRAKYNIVSQTTEANMEPLKWPIAPDGYIPNSVIRSWRTGKKPARTDCCNAFYSLHQVNECTTNDEEDIRTRILWFVQDEEEENEKTDDVKMRKKEKVGRRNKKDKVEEAEVEGKERVDEKKEREEDKMDRSVPVKESYDIHMKTTVQNQLKTCDDGKMNVEPREVSSTHSSRKTVNFLPTSCHENGRKPLRELRDDMKLPLPPQYLSSPHEQRTSSFIPEGWPESPVKSPVVPADTLILKQEPRIILYIPPMEPKTLTPHPLKPPFPTQVDPEPQPQLWPPKCSPIRDKRFHLSSAKYNNIRDEAQVHRDKVLELYKKFKISNNNSHLGKLSTTAQCPLAPKATRSTIQTNTGRMILKGGVGSPSESRATHPECLSNPLCSNYPVQFAQTILPKDQRSHKSMPEWRKNLYKHISLHGFCSPRAARLAPTEYLVESSSAGQLAATIPSLPGQAETHQRVVQKIQMKDTLEPASSRFHYVIPMASRQSFFALNPCGKTQYGRLQFEWMRRSEEEIKDTAHKVLDENKDLKHLDRSA